MTVLFTEQQAQCSRPVSLRSGRRTDFVPKAFFCNFLISIQEQKQYIALMSVKKSIQHQGYNVHVCVRVTVR